MRARPVRRRRHIDGPSVTQIRHPRALPASRRGFLSAALSCAWLLVAAALSPARASSDDAIQNAAAHPPARPRIGLVLAGGGAKGGAHIGVLKVLEELHVPIDCIAGTSMGALVGGGYASGIPAEEIERFVRGVDWKAVVGGVGRREREPVEQRRNSGDTSALGELSISDDGLVIPAGLVDTGGIEDLLRRYVAQARLEPDFDLLPIPFRAVATDMIKGRMVVLDHGDLATAMRASMAIPGAFAPVVSDPYILSDGFVVRNIPVDVARQTCADVVIVVRLVSPPAIPDELRSAPQLISRTMDVMVEANERAQLNTLTDRDVLIDVPMGTIGPSDFERTPDTIALGEAAARAVADRLRAFSVSAQDYAAWRASVTTRQKLVIRVANVRFQGLKHVNPEYLRSLTEVHPGDVVDTSRISLDALRLGALEDLDSVEYRFLGDPSHPDLVWVLAERSGGRDFIRPNFGLYGNSDGDVEVALGLQYVSRWLNPYGGQWRNNLQLGYQLGLTTSLYQPFNIAQTFFAEPRLLWQRSVQFLYSQGNRIAEFDTIDLGGQVDLGAALGHNAQLRLGYWNENRRLQVTTGIPLSESGVRDAGPAATIIYDSRNEGAFATRGTAAEIDYVRSDDSMGANRDWQYLEGGYRTAVRVGKNLMWATVAGGTDLGGSLPADRAFRLGGTTFPGYNLDELRMGSYWTASGSFLWRLVDVVAIRDRAIYGGFALQAGRIYQRVDPVPDGMVYGGSLYLAGQTPIGALTLGGGWATSSWNVWVSIGRPIGAGSILDKSLFR